MNGAVGQQMYREMVQPVVERFCQGYNGCILAYGQTGETQPFHVLVHNNSRPSHSSSTYASLLPAPLY